MPTRLTDLLLICSTLACLFSRTSPVHTDHTRYQNWSRTSSLASLESVSCLRQEAVKSVLGCASRCSLNDGCGAFCHSRVTHTCYVLDGRSASKCELLNDRATDCFENCPMWKGYLKLSGRCLKVGLTMESMAGATAACAVDNAHLPFTKTEQDIDSLLSVMVEKGFDTNGTSVVWLGGGDAQEEGAYYWSDGTPLSNVSSLWAPFQPDNAADIEDCLVYNQATNRLHDRYCNNSYQFLCEIDM